MVAKPAVRVVTDWKNEAISLSAGVLLAVVQRARVFPLQQREHYRAAQRYRQRSYYDHPAVQAQPAQAAVHHYVAYDRIAQAAEGYQRHYRYVDHPVVGVGHQRSARAQHVEARVAKRAHRVEQSEEQPLRQPVVGHKPRAEHQRARQLYRNRRKQHPSDQLYQSAEPAFVHGLLNYQPVLERYAPPHYHEYQRRNRHKAQSAHLYEQHYNYLTERGICLAGFDDRQSGHAHRRSRGKQRVIEPDRMAAARGYRQREYQRAADYQRRKAHDQHLHRLPVHPRIPALRQLNWPVQ